MGHPQPPTPIKVDNSTCAGFANDTIRQRRSKALDMRFYWLRDQNRLKRFCLYWRPADKNYADYYSKNFPPSVHREIRPTRLIHPPHQANYFAPLDDDESVDEPNDDTPLCTRSIQDHCSDEHRSTTACEGVLIPVPDRVPYDVTGIRDQTGGHPPTTSESDDRQTDQADIIASSHGSPIELIISL